MKPLTVARINYFLEDDTEEICVHALFVSMLMYN